MKLKAGPINRSVLVLALPSILANITVPLVGMADVAISGRLGDAASIGAVAVASMLFDLLYWNMGFLRIGTGSVAAQAYGRGDWPAVVRVFVQGMAVAVSFAALFILLQYPFLEVAFSFVNCSPEVEQLARAYFYIRIWAAPATLSLNVFKGWFIGMQNTIPAMFIDVTVNLVNVGASAYLALFTPLGFVGIAWGTLIAQYCGVIVGVSAILLRYAHHFKGMSRKISDYTHGLKHFFMMNGNLFIRSLCLLAVYTTFTTLAADYGDVQLAVSTIMMKLMLLYSYFVDGFAYAGEALSGRYVGAGQRNMLKSTVKTIFVWCLAIGAVSTVAYGLWGDWMFGVLTDVPEVIAASGEYMFWLLIMPIMSCIAFTWDGVYIGVGASVAIRRCMLLSVAGYFAGIFISRIWLDGVQTLWVGFAMHLVVRTLYMSLVARKEIFTKPFNKVL